MAPTKSKVDVNRTQILCNVPRQTEQLVPFKTAETISSLTHSTHPFSKGISLLYTYKKRDEIGFLSPMTKIFPKGGGDAPFGLSILVLHCSNF